MYDETEKARDREPLAKRVTQLEKIVMDHSDLIDRLLSKIKIYDRELDLSD